MVEGTPLLREHTGQNLYPGFESLRLRHERLFVALMEEEKPLSTHDSHQLYGESGVR